MTKIVKITNVNNTEMINWSANLVNKKGTGIDLNQLVNSKYCGDNDNIAEYDELDNIIDAGKEDDRWAVVAEKLQELGEGSVVLMNSLIIKDWWTGADAERIEELYCGDYKFELVNEDDAEEGIDLGDYLDPLEERVAEELDDDVYNVEITYYNDKIEGTKLADCGYIAYCTFDANDGQYTATALIGEEKNIHLNDTAIQKLQDVINAFEAGCFF